eukprot:4164263-Amphidinium_carterae.1
MQNQVHTSWTNTKGGPHFGATKATDRAQEIYGGVETKGMRQRAPAHQNITKATCSSRSATKVLR